MTPTMGLGGWVTYTCKGLAQTISDAQRSAIYVVPHLRHLARQICMATSQISCKVLTPRHLSIAAMLCKVTRDAVGRLNVRLVQGEQRPARSNTSAMQNELARHKHPPLYQVGWGPHLHHECTAGAGSNYRRRATEAEGHDISQSAMRL